MMDVYEMLRQKENDIERVRKEIWALRFVAPMLSDSDDPQVLKPEQVLEPAFNSDTETLSLDANVGEETPAETEQPPEALEVGQAIPPKRSRLRNLLGLAAGE
jgi:hypothetical protein